MKRACFCGTNTVVFLTCLLLSACGGGGGGDGGSPPVAPPPTSTPTVPVANYTGSRDPVVLSKANAAEAAGAVIAARSITSLAESVWVDVTGANGDVSQTVAGPNGGSASISGTLSNGVGTIEVVYNQFQGEGVTIDGRYVQVSQAESGGSAGFIYFNSGPGTLGFDDLGITTPDGTIELRGSLRISGGNKQNVDLNLTALEAGSGETAYFEDLSLDFSTGQIGSSSLFAVSVTGRAYDSVEGYIDIKTFSPVVDFDYYTFAEAVIGQHGSFGLSAGGSDVRVDVLSRVFVSVGIDLDGDTLPDEARRVSWRALNGVDDPFPSYGVGPIANAGNQLAGQVGGRVTVHGGFSHDDDGDWLTHEWRLVAKPLASQLELPTGTVGGVEFLPDVQGQYVLSLTVSDGVDLAETGLVFDVAPEGQEPRDAMTRIAAIELPLPIQLGTSNIIDGRGSAQDGYGYASSDWFVEGGGNESWTAQDGGLVIDYMTDTIGLKEARFNSSGGGIGYLSAYTELDFFAGRAVPDLQYRLINDVRAEDLTVADYDGDGEDDLLLSAAALGVGGLQVLIADGTGGYTPQPIVSGPIGEIAAGDLNGDGRVDVAIAGLNGVYVSYQQGDGTPADFVIFPFAGGDCFSEGDIGIGDIDGDGLDDLAAVILCENQLVAWQQQTDGTLGDSVVQVAGERVRYASFLDVNADAQMDAILGVFNNGSLDEATVVALGAPNGTFEPSERFAFDVSNAPIGSAGDVNGDGLIDIISLYPGYLEIFERQADGSAVQRFSANLPPGTPTLGRMDVVDVDNDGLNDLLYCDFVDLTVGFQTAAYEFDFAKIGNCSQTFGGRANAFVMFDYDRDGIDDIVSSSRDSWLQNSEKSVMLHVLFGGLKAYSTPR